MMNRLIKLIARFIKPYNRSLIYIVILQTISAAMALYLPTLNARIIDQGIVRGDLDYIWHTGWIMLGLAAIQVTTQVTTIYLGAQVAMGFGRDLRATFFDRVLSFSARELDLFGPPSLITRNTNDTQQVQMLVFMSLVMVLSAPITMAGGIIMALREDAGLSWIILVVVIILGAGISLILTKVSPLYQAMQKRLDKLNHIVREQITGIRVIRAFVRENHEAKRFERTNADLTDVTLKVGRFMAIFMPFVMLVLNLSTVGVMWFGAHRIQAGYLEIGQLTAFLSYLMQILLAIMLTTMVLIGAPRAAVSAGRLLEVLNTKSSVINPKHPMPLSTPNTIEFCNVDFSHPGAEAPVLKQINLILSRGKTTAIIGSTGAGKSTLVNLIPRLFDVTGGKILINGIDLRELDQETLWQHIGLVPQKPYLFSGTVAANLRYGNPEATTDELWQALAIAQSVEFVKQKEDDLQSYIAQGGTNVSGGQRQRLAIARAIVKRPSLYIFDDSFSALDLSTDYQVRQGLSAETKQAAVLIVAQRISTIKDADEIIVLEHGEIVGKGRHEELLESCPTYQEIAESQISATEAAKAVA